MLTDQHSGSRPDTAGAGAGAGAATAAVRRPLPWRGMAWAALAALGLHLAVLSRWPAPAPPPAGPQAGAVSVQARVLPIGLPALPATHPGMRPSVASAAPPPAALTAPEPAPAPAPAAAPVPATAVAATPRVGLAPPLSAAAPVPATGQAPAPASTEPLATEPPAIGPDAPAVTAGSLDALLTLAPPAAGPSRPPATTPEAEAAAPPVYATRFAPPARLVFRLQRGLLRGDAVLNWQHAAGGPGAGTYQLALDARAAGLSILSQTSQGGFDAAGLAPLRFTDRRLRSSTRATSFQRERGLVSFSGPSVQYPLFPGAQDRLSWMMQLPAIVAALPAARRASTEVEMHVFGARGDLSVWQFREQAAEPVMTDRGPVAAVKWLRAPRASHDTLVEMWLDPAQHYLPIKVRIGNPPDGETLELLRESAS